LSNFVIDPYRFAGVSAWYDTLDFPSQKILNMNPAGIPARGEGTNGGSSAMIGETVRVVKCYLSNQTGSALDGTIYAEVNVQTDNTLRKSIGTYAASNLTAAKELITFEAATGYTIVEGDTIGIRTDGSAGKTVTAYASVTSAYDGTDSCKSYFTDEDPKWVLGEDEDWIAYFSE